MEMDKSYDEKMRLLQDNRDLRDQQREEQQLGSDILSQTTAGQLHMLL